MFEADTMPNTSGTLLSQNDGENDKMNTRTDILPTLPGYPITTRPSDPY